MRRSSYRIRPARSALPSWTRFAITRRWPQVAPLQALRRRSPMADHVTLPELEQYLAKAADLLRGSIDQADFKAYIFPLMFFKRISDAYLEEYAQALEESGGDHEFAAFAENHRFTIPAGNLWGDVRDHTEN